MVCKMHRFNHATAFARPCIRFPICLENYSTLSKTGWSRGSKPPQSLKYLAETTPIQHTAVQHAQLFDAGHPSPFTVTSTALQSPIFTKFLNLHFFSIPVIVMGRQGRRDASSGSEAGPPLGQKLKRVTAFSAAAHRVAAPAALTEHRWLAKLSSHTTWRGAGSAHAPAGGRRSPSYIISRVTQAQTRRGARLRSFDQQQRPPPKGCQAPGIMYFFADQFS